MILLPMSLANEWRGADSSDYARACAVDELVGIVSVGSGGALVLGDEPLSTAWLPDEDGGLLARWLFAPNDAVVAEHLRTWKQLHGWREAVSFVQAGQEAVLMPAADSALNPVLARYPVYLAPGTYSVSSLEYHPDDETSLRLHRLRKSAT